MRLAYTASFRNVVELKIVFFWYESAGVGHDLQYKIRAKKPFML